MTKKSLSARVKLLLPYWILLAACIGIGYLSWLGPYPHIKWFVVPTFAGCVALTVAEQLAFVDRLLEYISSSCWNFMKGLKDVRWKGLIISCAIAIAGAGIIERILCWGQYFHYRKALFFFAIIFLISCVVIYRDNLIKKIEIVVAGLIIVVGGTFVLALPASCGIAWDDEAHFRIALNMSHRYDSRMLQGDYEIINGFVFTALEHNIYNYEDYKEYIEKLDSYGDEFTNGGRDYFTIDKWCYVPACVGMTVGRVAGLPYHMIFLLGRWCNLLTYALLVYIAIGRLKSGKMIAASVAMLPQIIFMASTYSRDPWMIGFIMIGMCHMIGCLQDKDKKFQIKDVAVMVGCIFVGIMPKAVYFPLVFVVVFIPSDRFENKWVKKVTVILAVLAMAVAVASFALPFIQTSGASATDVRGGENVNSGSQASYVLNNPLKYIVVFAKFFWDYISLNHAAVEFGNFHYLGTQRFGVIVIMVLLVVSLIDRSNYDVNVSGGVKSAILLMSFGTIVLCATAMYVAYTPYGSDTILGCQYRYMYQFFFPVLWVLGSFRFQDKLYYSYRMDRIAETIWFRGIVLCVMSALSFVTLWNLLIANF